MLRGNYLIVVGLLTLVTVAQAFNLSDHARDNLISFSPVVATHEAETLAGIPADCIIDDPKSFNGKAVRLSPMKPMLSFSADLTRSTYSVWVMGRSSEHGTMYREPMYVHLYVKGPSIGPGRNTARQWRTRINYDGRCYQDVAHLYFDANAPGTYEISVCLGHESVYQLTVDRLIVRDVLGHTAKKAVKTKAMLHEHPPWLDKEQDPPFKPFSRREALQRALDIAASFPPRNSLRSCGTARGYEEDLELTKLVERDWQRWTWKLTANKGDAIEKPWVLTGPVLPEKRDDLDKLLDDADEEESALGIEVKGPTRPSIVYLGVMPDWDPKFDWASGQPGELATYTAEDYHAFNKLPGRFPDDGGGYFIPQTKAGKSTHNVYYYSLAQAFSRRWSELRRLTLKLVNDYHATGDPRIGFRAAVLLVHFADAYPSIEFFTQPTKGVTFGGTPFNYFGGKPPERGKFSYSGWAGTEGASYVYAYDKIFDYIKDNQLLADAIGQTIAWVKTPQHMIELLDVKLVQHVFDLANRVHIRFESGQRCAPSVAMVAGVNDVGLSMLDAIVNKPDYAFTAMEDNLIVGRSRDSTSFIGSMFYGSGPSVSSALAVVGLLDFSRKYNLPRFDLTKRTRILYQAAQWAIENYVTGLYINGVGDVAGRFGWGDTDMGISMAHSRRLFMSAWQEYGDPRFAWMLVHVYGFPTDIDEKTIAAATSAAEQCPGDPRRQPSRVLDGFGVAILELNGAHPDFWKRTGVVMRSGGAGSGHSHADGLNLQIFAKGLVSTAELGGRNRYGSPQTTSAKVHCLPTVDGRAGAGKTSILAHLPQSPCMESGWGTRKDDGSSSYASRFVALIDAGNNDAYLFDIVRAGGGKTRTYWFHSSKTDVMDSLKIQRSTAAASLLAGNDGSATDLTDELMEDIEKDTATKWAWNPNTFSHSVTEEDKNICNKNVYQAVWPLRRDMERAMFARMARHHFPKGQPLTYKYNPNSPRKFTRLILLGSKGRKVDTFVAKSVGDCPIAFRYEMIGVNEIKAPTEQTLFPALIEPFEGTNFITSFEPLPVTPDNVGKPYALAVEIRDHRRDILFQTDTPSQEYTFAANGSKPLHVTGKFGYVSYDRKGVRACALVAGTSIKAHNIGIEIGKPWHEARIVAVDYKHHTIQLDAKLPATLLSNSYFQLGSSDATFRITEATATDKGTILHYQKTAEHYRGEVFVVNNNSVTSYQEPECGGAGCLTNEKHDKFWRVEKFHVGLCRWMTTSFRGSASLGTPISWDDIPDTDGDGNRSLMIGPGGGWTTGMSIDVLRVDENRRVFAFHNMTGGEGYGGTRTFAGKPISNEAGRRIGTSTMPGKMVTFWLDKQTPATMEDFTDDDSDGVTRFHVYHFGPGDPARLQTYAAVERQKDGSWLVTANTPLTVTIPEQGKVRVVRLSENDLHGGTTIL